MGLRRTRGSKMMRASAKAGEELGLELGLGFSRCSGSLGTKRVLICDAVKDLSMNSTLTKKKKRVTKKETQLKLTLNGGFSAIQTLPQDILVRIISCVNHDDLKQLFHVSKSFRDATLIAKRVNFDYSTPSKIRAFNTIWDENGDEIEAPNAPRHVRKCRSRLSQKKISEIAVVLFPCGEDDE